MIDPKQRHDTPVAATEAELRSRSRRGFLALAAGAAVSVGGWKWLNSRGDEDGITGPYRRALDLNQKLTSKTLFGDGHLAPEFPRSKVREIRANGDLGLDDDVDMDAWRLGITPLAKTPERKLSLADLRSLPKVEETFEFKCIEGWSTVTNWGGVRLRDFTARFAPGSEHAHYVGLTTPDEKYYVGLDMASALHPQTLLAFEKDGQPLDDDHGAPLRLIVPVKYGIKNLKRIGAITYTDERPADFWAEQGYDYYAAL